MGRRRRPKSKPYVYKSPERTKGYQRIRAVVGPKILKRVREELGKKQVDDVALELGKKLTEKEVKEIKRLRGRKSQLPLSEIDKRRAKEIKEIREKRPPVRFFKRKDGFYDRKDILTGKKTRVTARSKQQYESSFGYRRYVDTISKILPISKSKARNIIKVEREKAVRELRRFKKTKKFKSLSKKKQRQYTEERTQRWAVIRLMLLLNERWESP